MLNGLKKAIAAADLVILVLDASEPLTKEDRQLLTDTADEKRIIILNKTDLPLKLEMPELEQLAGDTKIIKASMTQNQGSISWKARSATSSLMKVSKRAGVT